MQAWQRRNVVIIGVVGLAMLGTGLFLGIGASQGPAPPATVATTITIDPNIGETFAPAPADAGPKLTAQQAFVQHRRLNGRGAVPIPAGVTVKLGLLTILAGPTNPHTGKVVTKDGIAYAALNELAWGYSWNWCPMSRNPLKPGRVPGPCTRWNFLNANTGREIDEDWQQGSFVPSNLSMPRPIRRLQVEERSRLGEHMRWPLVNAAVYPRLDRAAGPPYCQDARPGD